MLVTIAILAILATVSVVSYTTLIEKSAVSTDSYLVAQLNDLTKLYEIEHSGDFEEADVRKLLNEAGITSLQLKSESYSYQLYFNQNNQKFELTNSVYSEDEGYLLINNDFLSKTDVDVEDVTPPNDGEGEDGVENENNNSDTSDDSGDTTNPSTGEDNQGSDDKESDESDQPIVIMMEDFVQRSSSLYVKGENGTIHIGIKIDSDTGAVNSNAINFSKINFYEESDVKKSNPWIISKIELDGVDITSNKNSFNFSKVGTQCLKFTLSSPDLLYTKELEVNACVCNVNIDNASIDYSNHKTLLTVTPTADNSSLFNLEFLILKNIVIYDYDKDNQIFLYNWNEVLITEKTQLLERIRLTIKSDTIEYVVENDSMIISKAIDASTYLYQFVIIENVEEIFADSDYYITYEYLGNNGLWTSVTLPVEKTAD